MKKDVYIFEVKEKSFDETVLHNSKTLPVFVQYMGYWSEPCVVQAAIIESLANEFASQFIFAKVDIDESPALRKEYSIQNVPTLKVFVDGEAVVTEEGQITEDECRALLKQFSIFHESDEMRLQARELHLSGDTQQAFILLTEAIKKDPQNTRIAMDMVQIFLDTKLLDNANALFNKLPPAVKETTMGQSLARQLAFANQAANTAGAEALIANIKADANDFASRFDYAICLIAEYDYKQAIDELFVILENKADFKDGAAKELLISITNILKENEPEIAKEVQQRMSNLLAS